MQYLRFGCLLGLVAGCGSSAAAPPATPTARAPGDEPQLAITSTAELVAPGIASSEYSEIRLGASPDGTLLLWGSTNRPGGDGGWDIWLSRRTNDAWSAPAPVAFGSPENDFDPAFSADGRFVYFFSNRPGGLGGDDLYRVPVSATGFGAVEHLSAAVNSAGNEWAPAPSPDGTRLLFATDGRGGAGRHDLFIARVDGVDFAPAEPVPGALNTPADEFDAAWLADDSLVFARSTNVDADPIALQFAARGPDGYGVGTPLPPSVNVDGGYTLGPAIDWSDRSILYFTGIRPEAAAGKLDLYRVRYEVR